MGNCLKQKTVTFGGPLLSEIIRNLENLLLLSGIAVAFGGPLLWEFYAVLPIGIISMSTVYKGRLKSLLVLLLLL